jgi:uncharacterized membrane protein
MHERQDVGRGEDERQTHSRKGNRRRDSYGAAGPNVGSVERMASVAIGALLALGAVRARRLSVARAGFGLLAAAFAGRGITGRCAAYRAAGIDTSNGGLPALGSGRREVRIEQRMTLCSPREKLYDRWRDLANLPLILRHVEHVEVRDDRLSHWVLGGPSGRQVEWDAEITEDRPGEIIAWRSLPGSDVLHEGSVRFSDAPPGRGSQIELTLLYRAGAEAPLAPLLRKLGEHEIREDLRRFKQWIEAGEIPTTEGQPSGRARDRGRADASEQLESGEREPGSRMRSVRPAARATAEEGGAR